MKPLTHGSRINAGTKMGRELFQTNDEFGEIVISQRGNKRVLSFGSTMEQSCVYINKPYYLAHDYGQAMLLGLIFIEPRHITLLGLGGGGMANCLSHYFSDTTIVAIELRQTVIDAAYKWFYLPSAPNFHVFQHDAHQFILSQSSASTDLIMSDLYENDCMSDLQRQKKYFEQCHEVLTDNGCLVLNFHIDPEDELFLMETLELLFSSIYTCQVGNGNWVLYCVKQPTTINHTSLKKCAQKLASHVQMPIMYYYRMLKVI